MNEYIEMGIKLDAMVNKEVLTSIFLPYSPLHDGAVVIQKDRISVAGCFLPMSMKPGLDKELGTRHRAAIGLSEETDAVVIVISEERGSISIVSGGQIIKDIEPASLRLMLYNLFEPKKKK